MSKKTIKKNIKLNKDKKKNEQDPRKNVMNTVKIIVGIVLVVAVFYVISALLKGEYRLSRDNKIDTSIILASKTFSQKSKDYYVFFYDFDGDDKDEVSSIIKTNNANTFYKVDIRSKLNSGYISLFGNADADKIEDLKISSFGTTLMHISDGHNIDYLEGIDKIKESFN